LRKSLAYDTEVLKIKEISGDLSETYVHPGSWEK
jgi:hypothetical protein